MPVDENAVAEAQAAIAAARQALTEAQDALAAAGEALGVKEAPEETVEQAAARKYPTAA